MKKFLIVVGILFALGVVGVFAITKIDFNRMNADNYYLQITEDGIPHDYKLDDGSVMTTYSYQLDATNADGKTIPLKFTAQKNLRKDAYLKMYVKKDDQVSSYDEVELEDIPNKAQKQLK
ncbi:MULTISPECIES: YxeA family protein [Psychrobacillus]|uniref:YxeA family protein n=1 Tax=Psychrobacillus lasiicapitis TaxID=1636719 RepID=A0A544SSH5_9BACI|nr:MULTISPECIES: YxeA family protein [Psychrobacillus]MDI2588617.1 YxeA family protein [Psychrobacillus sp. NEAU-3TGS]TQR08153.1 YxeA family protein [Psychrobacillus lasiicapitis]GGA49373.1 membrane protein [Psychrobacillus lasiicapitis]